MENMDESSKASESEEKIIISGDKFREAPPLFHADIIGKYVKIETEFKHTYEGWVESMDPGSKSLILLKFNELEPDICSNALLVPGFNIKFLKILDKIPSHFVLHCVNNIFKRKEVQLSKGDLEERRESLCLWLSDNRVPYTLTDKMDIEVLQVACIIAPYGIDNIQCTNEVVLDKLIKLVSSVPVRTS